MFKLFLAGFMALGVFLSILEVNKEREPLKPSTVALNALFMAIIIYGLFNWM